MWLLINGRIIYGEVCYQDHPWWLALMFTTIDTSLSLTFLYLFLEPVLQQLKIMHQDSYSTKSVGSQKMQSTARKNLHWSSVTIGSTFIFMMMVSIVPQINTSEESRHLHMITWVAQPIDSFVTMIGMLAITSGVWMPKTSQSATVLPTSRAASSVGFQ